MSESLSSLAPKANAWEMELFWAKHKRRIVISFTVLVVAALGVGGYLLANYIIDRASTSLLSRASSVEQLQTVASRYPSSNAAASALLLLAAEERRLGNLEGSNAAYQKLLTRFPKHPLAAGAALGVVENILIAGRVAEAIASLQTLAAKYPSSYVAPFALYTQTNLLVAQPGQAAEAEKQLENLIRQYPDSVSARSSVNLLGLLKARHH